MFELKNLSEKTLSNLKKDFNKKKEYLLKNITKNQKHKIFTMPGEKYNFAEVSLNTNGGDMRSLMFFIETKDEKNKPIMLSFYLEDYTIGAGKYTKNDNNKSSYDIYPLGFQVYNFTHQQFFSINKLEKRGFTFGEDVKHNNFFNEELKDLFNIVYLTEEERTKYYTQKNLDARIRSFNSPDVYEHNKEDLKKIKVEDIEIVKPFKKNDSSSINRTSFFGSYQVIFDKKNLTIKPLEEKPKNEINSNYDFGIS